MSKGNGTRLNPETMRSQIVGHNAPDTTHVRHVDAGAGTGHGLGTHDVSGFGWPLHESRSSQGETGGRYGTPVIDLHIGQSATITERELPTAPSNHLNEIAREGATGFREESERTRTADSPASAGRQEMPHKEDVGKVQEAAREIEHIGNTFRGGGTMADR
jgi:hypothetical protein